MKKTEEIKKSKKNPTHNYPMDSHKEFCKRCKKFNGGCPSSNPKDCSL